MRKKLFIFCGMLMIALSALAQVTVRGVVISAEDKEPVIGATVQIKENKSVATATDLDGKFTLTAPSAKSTVLVTYIGMKPAEVKVQPGKELHIVLESNATELGEIVVTGMQKMDKRLFTGATAKIDADKARLDGVADISRGLEGKAAGVSVQNVSGTFGTAPKIRVRGATSIYGTSKPLWVVDGVILEDAVEISADELSSGDAETLIASAVAGLNADDIESFQILKDGSATSIYGARAMAGVIVVNTKQGRAGNTSIKYTGELTYRLKPSYSEYNISNSQEQMGIYKEMEQKGWLEFASLASSSSSGVYGTMYKLIDSYANGKYGLPNTTEAKNNYLRQAEFRNTDWFDLLFNSNVMQNHSVSISGGTDKGRFYTSASVMYDPGWYKKSEVNRYTFNANASYELSRTLRVKLLTSDSYRKQTAPGTLSQDVDVVSGQVNRSFDINPFSYSLNTSRVTDPTATLTRNYADFNIFRELDNNYIDIGVTDLKFQGEINWRPIAGLEIIGIASYRYSKSSQNHYVKDNSNQAMAYRAGVDPEDATIRYSNPYLYTDPDEPNALPETVLPKGGIMYHKLFSMSQFDVRATAQYNKTFNNTHILNVMGGFTVSDIERHGENYQGWGICYDNGNIPFIDWHLFKQQSEENTNYFSDTWTYRRDAAFFGTASYSYLGKYILNGTIRYDGSNKLGKSSQSRWLPTWNVSAAWNIHDESWFANRVLSHAKLRASYSLTGESGPSWVSNATAIYNPYKPWRPVTDANELGLSLDEIANSELTYEKKHEFDLGVDLGFINNRINVVFDWYKRDNYDLVGMTYTAGTGGQIAKYANVASMSSHGVEFTLSTRNIQNKNLTWTTDLTFSFAKNKITDLKTRSRVIDLVKGAGYAREGYPVRAIFSIPFVGLNDEGIPMVINENGEVTTSDIYFQEFEKLDHLKYEGPTDPTITGGFGNMVSWKGFHLNVFLTYAFGNKVRLDPVFAAAYSDLTAMPKEFKNRWVKPGDELLTDVPVIASRRQYKNDPYLSYAYNAYNYSTARIADGGFIRLKEVSVTYDLPSRAIRALRLSNASVKLQATNLCLLYSDKKLNGQDPEFFNSGGVASPNPKQFTFTLRLGL